VRVMGNTERKPGLAGARNTGILASEGEYVAFCDDDDIWLPAKLAKQVAGIGTALTSATGIVIDYGGHRAERIPAKDTFKLENLVRNRIMEAHPSSVMVRRSAILDRIGLVDEELPGSYAEDFDFIIRALQAGPVAIVEEALVVVRWGQSLFSRNWGTIVAAVDYLIDKHQVIRDDPKALARLYGRRGFANAASGEYREALQDAWQAIRRNPLEKRAYVTLLAASRIVPATKLLDMAHRRGRGI
jgi:glycosyltransferase involved in cell wall biosynthesis